MNVGKDRSFLRLFDGSRRFVEAVMASAALMARTRAIRDEVVQTLSSELAGSVGRAGDDPDACLAARLLVAIWTVAFVRAHGAYRRDGVARKAKILFLSVVDQGSAGVEAAMAGAPYAQTF